MTGTATATTDDTGRPAAGRPGDGAYQPTARELRLVIAASSAGTVFEWYDFFIYGTLAAIIGRTFFPSGNATLETLLVWAGFAVGFGFRPLGAILFGYLGDRLGRKTTFLVTVTLMGVATAGVGLIPSAANIGIAAPILVLVLRILQGLALGGEYGGAAIYVAEHAPQGRRGFTTSFIQASVVGGFVLSLVVVLSCKAAMAPATFDAWGWRVPFLLSLILLAISLWMRLALSESPVFRAMKADGRLARNPFVESFTTPGNKRRILIALFGISAGLTVIWYTAMFSGLAFLKGPMRIEDTAAEVIVGASAALGMVFFILAGRWSDRVGRKRPIVLGYAATLALLFPAFWLIGAVANPGMAAATAKAPVVVSGTGCNFNPFAAKQATVCGAALGELNRLGIPYTLVTATTRDAPPADAANVPPAGDRVSVAAGAGTATTVAAIEPMLRASGYPLDRIVPTPAGVAGIMAALLLLGLLSGLTYGPVAALLTEMFPPAVRYSSMSIPYHIGTGYFGGFLPFIASYIIARTGDPYAGLWYTWGVVAMALVVTVLFLKPRDMAFGDDSAPA